MTTTTKVPPMKYLLDRWLYESDLTLTEFILLLQALYAMI